MSKTGKVYLELHIKTGEKGVETLVLTTDAGRVIGLSNIAEAELFDMVSDFDDNGEIEWEDVDNE